MTAIEVCALQYILANYSAHFCLTMLYLIARTESNYGSITLCVINPGSVPVKLLHVFPADSSKQLSRDWWFVWSHHFHIYMYMYVHATIIHGKGKQRKAHKAVSQFQLSCSERNLTLRSPAYMAGILSTKPPWQLRCTCTYNVHVYTHIHTCIYIHLSCHDGSE